MRVRVTTTYKATAVIEVNDDFDPEHDDLNPREFEPTTVNLLTHHGVLDRVSTFAEYDFA